MMNRGIVRRFRIRSFRTRIGRLAFLLTVSATRLHRLGGSFGRHVDSAAVSGSARKRTQYNGNDQNDAVYFSETNAENDGWKFLHKIRKEKLQKLKNEN